MKNQKLFNIAAVVALAIALLVGGAALLAPKAVSAPPVVSSQSTSSPCWFSPGGVAFNAGSGCTINLDSGSALAGDSGVNITVDTLTATSLISQVVSFYGQSGNLTDTLLVQTLTVTGTATADGFSATYLTGTLGTANQPNITNLGTQTYLSATQAIFGGGYGSTGCRATSGGDVACNGRLDIDGAATITGTSSLIGAVTFVTNTLDSTALITPANDSTIIPTARSMLLNPAGDIGVQMGACDSGLSTVIYDVANHAIVITDTGNGILAGNQTLGQYDTLPLLCISGKWVQTGPVSAN